MIIDYLWRRRTKVARLTEFARAEKNILKTRQGECLMNQIDQQIVNKTKRVVVN